MKPLDASEKGLLLDGRSSVAAFSDGGEDASAVQEPRSHPSRCSRRSIGGAFAAGIGALSLLVAVMVVARSYWRSSRPTDHVSMAADVQWLLSESGASCSEACETEGLSCSEEVLTETDTEGEVLMAAQSAGHKCESGIGATAPWQYEDNPSVCSSKDCCGDGSCTGVCTYGTNGAGGSCDASQHGSSRLCPCAKKAPRWILGLQGVSCSDTCQQEGGVCDSAALQMVDSEHEIFSIAKAAGTHCRSSVVWAYDSNPAICTDSGCCGDGSCTNACAYGMSSTRTCHSRSEAYSRFCPCSHGDALPTSPTPSPPASDDVEKIRAPSWHWGSNFEGMESQAGNSWYTRVFTLLQEEPLDWQMGAAGSWMTPEGVDFDVCACDPNGWPSSLEEDHAYGCCDQESKCSWLYQTVEGGPGYWSGSQLPTQQMKWRIVVTTGCYSAGTQTPLFYYGGHVVPCDPHNMATIQLSNHMLLAPDGITFSREGLLGVGFVRTPVGKINEADDRNFWTLVFDTALFAGPVAYLLPEVFGARAENFEAESAHLKDFGSAHVSMNNGGGFGFEWNTLFTYRTGDFFKIPHMAVPSSQGKATFAMNGRGYQNADVYDPVEDILSRRKQHDASDIMAHGEPFGCFEGERDAHFRVSDDKTATVGTLVTEKGEDGCAWSMHVENQSGHFPRYFRASDMRPVDESAVPKALRQQEFPKKGSTWPFNGPYDALSKAPDGGCLTNPGPADATLYCAETRSPSWLAYRWYRFVDQPGLQSLGLSPSEKDFLQARVTRLHESLTGEDRWIKKGSLKVSELAQLDEGHLVVPPKGLEVGYVPIVVYEGVEKPSAVCEQSKKEDGKKSKNSKSKRKRKS